MTLDEAFVEALTADFRSVTLSEQDRVMLEYVEQVTRDATRISPAFHDRLRAVGFDDKGILLTREDGSYEWTETNAIDTLDAISDELKAFFELHRTEAGYWSALDYVDQTAIDIVDVGGIEYLRETYELALTC